VSIADQFERLGPWVTRFTIDGHDYGGGYDAAHDAAERIDDFHAQFPDVASILELGSLEGGHSVCLAQLPGVQRVVGIEGRAENIERARFVAELLGVSNVTFHVGDLATFDVTTLGSFAAVFNCGLLYHLPEPWRLLADLAEISDRMYLSTHYSPTAEATAHGYPGASYTEQGLEDPLSGLKSTSFWPTYDGLLAMLADAGWLETTVTFNQPDFPHGPLICLAATRPSRPDAAPTT
jgi:hypothetical protein